MVPQSGTGATYEQIIFNPGRFDSIRQHPQGPAVKLPKPQKGVVWIYGLFAADGVALYIGQTSNPRTRFSQHKTRHGLESSQFVILHTADQLTASDLEYAVISKYQAIGEAQWNIRTAGSAVPRQWPIPPMRRCVSVTEETYAMAEELARRDSRSVSNYVARLIEAASAN